jgi:hypothetical protein
MNGRTVVVMKVVQRASRAGMAIAVPSEPSQFLTITPFRETISPTIQRHSLTEIEGISA